ncbi:hypothetical protein HN51_020604 [Arachis hypogaea]|uniref:Transferring glycosyl group transferase n=2 Tax=Arachis TaxID=3817 RepID=A0A445C1L1_ARAHY|nr:uncharacterized protein At4g14100 [Arachis duranensis]XP_025615927.1 uncharacterized protein At4g14100 [Arachis hypogaea]XP_057729608.1 uncharacterized protein At4g14100-like [Arachis stenosperma]QHO32589.1 uncharacterized protein DS421_8g251120 [Arachis hypogaea]RYR44799.1 hypothetical protein Ahy_A08g041072 [Arachis hypogaea]
MATNKPNSAPPFLHLLLLLLNLLPLPISSSRNPKESPVPIPADWPHQFHSVLFMNRSGALQKIDLWYDWINGRNLNIIQEQLDDVILYDAEWNNGTSFQFSVDPAEAKCDVFQLEVGILRPNWLDGANYLGQETVDNFVCNVWEKADFIVYYEDVASNRPVKWIFYSGYTAHVMTFEVGAVLDDPNWQAPLYCFTDENEKQTRRKRIRKRSRSSSSFGRLMRRMAYSAHDHMEL